MKWTWDPNTLRYREAETGRFLGRAAVREYVAQSVAASANHTAHLAERAATGSLSPADWYEAMRAEIKGEYIRQYTLGIGGREQMTKSDWGKLGSQVQEQYKYLKGFRDEVAAGNLTEAQIAARAAMYSNSAREAFETGNAKAQKKAGNDEVKWTVDAEAEHCGDCLEFAALGWQLVEDDPFDGAEPGDGSTECLTGCKCFKEYRKATERGGPGSGNFGHAGRPGEVGGSGEGGGGDGKEANKPVGDNAILLARRFAQTNGFSPDKVSYDRFGSISESTGTRAEVIASYSPGTGYITLYPPVREMNQSQLHGIMAHEIIHAKVDANRNVLASAIRNELGDQSWEELAWESMKDLDGVSEYSALIWKNERLLHSRKVEETIAEIARLEANGMAGSVNPVWWRIYRGFTEEVSP